MVVYVFVLIKNKFFGGILNFDCIVIMVIFYDVLEVFIGDFFILVKYFNFVIKEEYKKIEKIVENKLIEMVLEVFWEDYVVFIDYYYYSEEEVFIVKVVDVFCVYLKMFEELVVGN